MKPARRRSSAPCLHIVAIAAEWQCWPHLGHNAHNLVAGHHGELGVEPLVPNLVQVRVADAWRGAGLKEAEAGDGCMRGKLQAHARPAPRLPALCTIHPRQNSFKPTSVRDLDHHVVRAAGAAVKAPGRELAAAPVHEGRWARVSVCPSRRLTEPLCLPK